MTAPSTDWIDDALAADPEVGLLAEAVSLALWVDQAFLRRARLRFLPRSAAGLEARLWFSPLCRTNGSLGITLIPAVADRLRAALASRPERLDAVARFTAAARGDDRPEAVLEHLLWSTLTPGSPDLSGRLSRLRDALLDDDPSRKTVTDNLSRWTLARLHGLPEQLRREPDVVLLAVAAAERLGVPCPLPVAESLSDEAGEVRSRLHETVDVGIALWTDGLHASIPPAPDSRTIRASGRATVGLTIRAVDGGDPIRATLWPGESVVPLTAWCEFDGPGRVGRTRVLAGTKRLVDVARAGRQLWIDEEGAVTIHDPGGRCVVRVVPGSGDETVAALSTDGRRMAIGHGPVTYVLDVSEDSATVVRELGHPGRVEAVALDGEGATLAAVAGGILTVAATDTVTAAIGAAVHEIWFDDGALVIATDIELLRYEPESGRRTPLASWARGTLGTVAHDPASDRIAWSLRDGTLAVRDRGRTVRVGTAPWQPTALAVGDSLFVAGNTAEVLAFSLTGEPPPSVTLGLFARQLFHRDGRLIAVGGGGTVVLEADDGSHYLVEPDTGSEADPLPVPDSLVLTVDFEAAENAIYTASQAAVTAQRFADLPGAVVLLGPAAITAGGHRHPGEDELPAGLVHAGQLMNFVAALHDVGVDTAVRLTGRYDDAALLPSARRWLRLDVDAVFVPQQAFVDRRHDFIESLVEMVRSAGRHVAVDDLPYAGTGAEALVEAVRRPTFPSRWADLPLSPLRLPTVQRFPPLPADADARLMILAVALALPGLVEFSAAEVLTLGSERLRVLRRFLAERAGNRVLRTGEVARVSLTSGVIGVIRVLDTKEIVCLANPTAEQQVVTAAEISSGPLEPLVSTAPLGVAGSPVVLGPHAAVWLAASRWSAP